MFEEVKAILIKQLRLDKTNKDKYITPESRFKEDLGADSLDLLQLLMTIEEENGIIIPEEKLASFSTVGDVVAYLESLK